MEGRDEPNPGRLAYQSRALDPILFHRPLVANPSRQQKVGGQMAKSIGWPPKAGCRPHFSMSRAQLHVEVILTTLLSYTTRAGLIPTLEHYK